ncbi:Patched domain-containing 3 [Gossypium arboreum]|uniref:Patched domain-containing 3 n=1 Tax=Gossypium arboreum TaxID=29729 RepID=A0A0B0MHR0_GOSAR|nr:Patched domain-containing 3 [Gossypium arboreum]
MSLYNQVYLHSYSQIHESKYNIIYKHLLYGRIYIIFCTHIQESFQKYSYYLFKRPNIQSIFTYILHLYYV